MKFLMAFASFSMICLIVAIIAYVIVTNRIIKDQDKQIAKLNTEVFRLQAKLHRATCRKAPEVIPEVIEIHDRTIDPENVPDFSKDWKGGAGND